MTRSMILSRFPHTLALLLTFVVVAAAARDRAPAKAAREEKTKPELVIPVPDRVGDLLAELKVLDKEADREIAAYEATHKKRVLRKIERYEKKREALYDQIIKAREKELKPHLRERDKIKKEEGKLVDRMDRAGDNESERAKIEPQMAALLARLAEMDAAIDKFEAATRVEERDPYEVED